MKMNKGIAIRVKLFIVPHTADIAKLIPPVPHNAVPNKSATTRRENEIGIPIASANISKRNM